MDLFKYKKVFVAISTIMLIACIALFAYPLVSGSYLDPGIQQIALIVFILFVLVTALVHLPKKWLEQEEAIELIHTVFQYVLVLFLLVLLIQEFYPIESFLNINYLLLITIFFGILAVLTQKEKKTQTHSLLGEQKITQKDYVLIFGAGIVGGILVYLKTIELGLMGVFISVVAALLIVLLSFLLLNDSGEEESNDKEKVERTVSDENKEYLKRWKYKK